VWVPAPGTTWQWQLPTPVDTSVAAAVYDIDGFGNSAEDVARLHATGRKVICYLSAGSAENFRPDFGTFPGEVMGSALDGWPDERWLDIRRTDLLRPIMAKRFDMRRDTGFDAVEPDNIDAYTNNTGFPLTAADQLRYNRMLAEMAHERGMSIGLKNDLDQIPELLPYFDFAVNEQCAEANECEKLTPFIRAGKAVFHVEYDKANEEFCPQSRALGLSSMRKRLELDAARWPC